MITDYSSNTIEENNCLLYFYASWNSSCNQASANLEYASNFVKVIKVNTTKHSSMKKKYNIVRIPTYILIENEIEKSRIMGNINSIFFKKWFDSHK